MTVRVIAVNRITITRVNRVPRIIGVSRITRRFLGLFITRVNRVSGVTRITKFIRLIRVMALLRVVITWCREKGDPAEKAGGN
jgi:hypothetical protein